MKLSIVKVLMIASICICSCSEANKKTTYNEQTQRYLMDFDEFTNTLVSTHPAIYKFTSPTDFKKLEMRLRSEIDNETSERDFIWKLSRLIASIGCSHTSLGFFNQQSKLVLPEEYFPLQVKLIENRLYVTDPMINKSIVENGQEITAINNVPISEIVDTAFKHISAQAFSKTAQKEMFNAYATTFIPYVLNFPKTYTIVLKNENIELAQLKEKPMPPPIVNPESLCQETLCLNEIDGKTVLMTIRSFAYYGEKTPIILNFLDESFMEIREKKYCNLIVDVRGNFGGTSEATIHFLKNTLHQPFQYFDAKGSDFGNQEVQTPFPNNFNGKMAFLISGFGNSSVGHLASILKDKDRVIFVGEALGSNQFCTANQKEFQLSNTQIKYTVGQNIFFTDVSERDASKIIEPDYQVTQTIEDYLTNKDVVLGYATNLLNSKL